MNDYQAQYIAARAEIIKLTRERDEARAAIAEYQKTVEWLHDQLQGCIGPDSTVVKEINRLTNQLETATICARNIERERDEARGKAAYMIEAFWLAIADLGHSDECDAPTGECTCWREAQAKALDVEECVQLCTRLRDAEDKIEHWGHVIRTAVPLLADPETAHRAAKELAWLVKP